MTKIEQDCVECIFCTIVEDRNLDYLPFVSCKKDHKINTFGGEYEPQNKPCPDYEVGEATWL